MNAAYIAQNLPLDTDSVDNTFFLEELIDATAKLEVYKEKIKDSKIDSSWFMPTLQQKEALASSALEGTQATLDGVLINQAFPNKGDNNINEVNNYYLATKLGYRILSREECSNDFFYDIHRVLMTGNVRKPELIGEYRTRQNYIGKNDENHSITYVPPDPSKVRPLMNNLINYINRPEDNFRPLVRTAIVHAQFETIHPFLDGNGRVGRLLIPMYLFLHRQIDLPCFFISEALERDKHRYYSLLNNTRQNRDWNAWIKFFLSTVAQQCDKYINIIRDINILYEKDLTSACEVIKSAYTKSVIDILYQYPIFSSKIIVENTGLPTTTVNRYLNILENNGIIFSNSKKRYKTYYYYDLINILKK